MQEHPRGGDFCALFEERRCKWQGCARRQPGAARLRAHCKVARLIAKGAPNAAAALLTTFLRSSESVNHVPARFSQDARTRGAGGCGVRPSATRAVRTEIAPLKAKSRSTPALRASRMVSTMSPHAFPKRGLQADETCQRDDSRRCGSPKSRIPKERAAQPQRPTYYRRGEEVSTMSPHTFLTMQNQPLRAGSKSSASTSYPEGSHRIASNATNPANGATAMIQKTFVPSAADSTGNRNSETVELERISV
ncbi:hypothetical protein AWB65_06729 [Caballeronia humi]|uniref:Uncharacterized protein n=1 Tax=Caballeronia humi TaxID=326474 RepID=A0A158JJD6_9BURK|nr:hypothetical protein AWB65_06729 [Caballeronia humi]